jgi:hypothetical protein
MVALDLFIEPLKVLDARYIALSSSNFPADLLNCPVQPVLAPPCDVHVRSFSHKQLRRSESNTTVAACDQRNLTF